MSSGSRVAHYCEVFLVNFYIRKLYFNYLSNQWCSNSVLIFDPSHFSLLYLLPHPHFLSQYSLCSSISHKLYYLLFQRYFLLRLQDHGFPSNFFVYTSFQLSLPFASLLPILPLYYPFLSPVFPSLLLLYLVSIKPIPMFNVYFAGFYMDSILNPHSDRFEASILI